MLPRRCFSPLRFGSRHSKALTTLGAIRNTAAKDDKQMVRQYLAPMMRDSFPPVPRNRTSRTQC